MGCLGGDVAVGKEVWLKQRGLVEEDEIGGRTGDWLLGGRPQWCGGTPELWEG